MEISAKPRKELRSKIGRITTAIAFAFVICSVAVGPARAEDRRGHDDNRGGDQHRDNRDRGERGPDVYIAPQPDYYYAPQPDYYTAPEPPDYYYAPQRQYNPPPEGVNLFFGF
jgi:uncharacterized protein DUF3824